MRTVPLLKVPVPSRSYSSLEDRFKSIIYEWHSEEYFAELSFNVATLVATFVVIKITSPVFLVRIFCGQTASQNDAQNLNDSQDGADDGKDDQDCLKEKINHK